MLNTCSIGRRWKSREGWSRPVLTGERGTLFPIPLLGWGLGLVLWWFSRWMARNAVSCGHDDDTGKAFCLRPLSGSRTATIGIVVGSVAGRSVWSAVQSGFAVVMAQVRRPVPFRTRKLRPGTAMVLHSRGCGRVARRRIQLSGPSGRVPLGDSRKVFFCIPLGVPGALRPAGTPIFYAFFRCSLPVACGRLPFHNTPRITWSASVTVINDVMRLTRYVRAGSRESRYDGKRHKPDD